MDMVALHFYRGDRRCAVQRRVDVLWPVLCDARVELDDRFLHRQRLLRCRFLPSELGGDLLQRLVRFHAVRLRLPLCPREGGRVGWLFEADHRDRELPHVVLRHGAHQRKAVLCREVHALGYLRGGR